MSALRVNVLPLSVLLLLGTPILSQAQETVAEQKRIKRRERTQFVRIHYDEFREPLALQTATVKYVLKNDEGEVSQAIIRQGISDMFAKKVK